MRTRRDRSSPSSATCSALPAAQFSLDPSVACLFQERIRQVPTNPLSTSCKDVRTSCIAVVSARSASTRSQGRKLESNTQRIQSALFPGCNRSHSRTRQAHLLRERGHPGTPPSPSLTLSSHCLRSDTWYWARHCESNRLFPPGQRICLYTSPSVPS